MSIYLAPKSSQTQYPFLLSQSFSKPQETRWTWLKDQLIYHRTLITTITATALGVFGEIKCFEGAAGLATLFIAGDFVTSLLKKANSLETAILYGDRIGVEEALRDRSIDPNRSTSLSYGSPLLHAIKKKQVEIVWTLCQSERVQCDIKPSPLFLAASKKDLAVRHSMIHALVSAKHPPNPKTKLDSEGEDGETALCLPIYFQDPNLLDFLLKKINWSEEEILTVCGLVFLSLEENFITQQMAREICQLLIKKNSSFSKRVLNSINELDMKEEVKRIFTEILSE